MRKLSKICTALCQSYWKKVTLLYMFLSQYPEISDFLGANNLGEVLSHMSTNPDGVGNKDSTFVAEPMRDADKQDVIE